MARACMSELTFISAIAVQQGSNDILAGEKKENPWSGDDLNDFLEIILTRTVIEIMYVYKVKHCVSGSSESNQNNS